MDKINVPYALRMTSAILLAAGLSRRMGTANKLLLPYAGKTILETTLANILAADLGEVIVVVGHEKTGILPIVEGKNVKIVENPHFAEGMTRSIQAGVLASDPLSDGYMICLSDMLWIQPSEYRLLADFFETTRLENANCIIQPVFQMERGNPVVFSKNHWNAILENTNMEACKPIVQRNKAHLFQLEMPSPSILQDVDTPAEYDALVTKT